MRPPYLTGDRIYLRAMLLADAAHSAAWFDGPIPPTPSRAEDYLQETLTSAWGGQDPLPLAIVRLDAETVVGGATVEGYGKRLGEVRLRTAPWLAEQEAGAVRAEALRLLVPWLRDECELMAVTAEVAADDAALAAAAEGLGMVVGVRLREHLARPGGRRADLLLYQALNAGWRVEEPRA